MQKFLVGLGVVCVVLLVIFEVSFFFGAAQHRSAKPSAEEAATEQQ